MTTVHHLDAAPTGAHTKRGDPVREILQQPPTLFGKLVHLASLRDPGTNRYHQILEDTVSKVDTDMILRVAHGEIFRQWRSLSLGAQCAELQCYLNIKSGHDVGAIRSWGHVERLDALCPPGTYHCERESFIADLLLAVRSLLYDFK